MESHNINKVELRNLQMDDYDQLARSFKRIYGDEDVFWTRAQIKKLNTIFPEGQVVIVVDNRIVGCALSIIVDYNLVKGDHTYAQVTGNETFNTHNPNGNILYGIEVFIHPDFRGSTTPYSHSSCPMTSMCAASYATICPMTRSPSIVPHCSSGTISTTSRPRIPM